MTKSFNTQILEQETSTFKYLKSYEKTIILQLKKII